MGSSKEHSRRVLTVMEGRKSSYKIVDDLERVAKERQWGFKSVPYINSDKIARYDFDDIPLEYIIFRTLPINNYDEGERFLNWLRKNDKVGINLNPAGGRVSTSDKHYQQGLFLADSFLKDYALPTFEAKNKSNVLSYVNGKRVKYPFVLKDRQGSTGTGIVCINQESDLDDIKNFSRLLIEQYIDLDYDWRVFVIGGVAVGVMRKTGNPDDPKNFKVWCMGHNREIEEDQEVIEILSKIACRAAEVSRLEYTGVDIIRDAKTKKYHILETNFAATWLTFVPITNIDIPNLIIDWLEERVDAKTQPIKKSVKRYIENRKKYLSRETLKNYEAILDGEKNITKKIKDQFKDQETKYLYDTGYLFKHLAKAYEAVVDGEDASKYAGLIDNIEHMPLSWAGNFIGPKCGTLEKGAILSALYLSILGKMREV